MDDHDCLHSSKNKVSTSILMIVYPSQLPVVDWGTIEGVGEGEPPEEEVLY